MLYVVATPIGNLQDLTARAREVLTSVPYVVCEDTRHSRILLNHLKSPAKLISLHTHSSAQRLDEIIDLLKSKSDVAYITDAGTPGISDPGGELVELAHQNNIPVSPIPGPSAVVTALSVSGFPSDQFIFLGYLPKKKGRQTYLHSLLSQDLTAVMFESPLRLKKTLADLRAILGNDRQICVCRELTKQFEEVVRGSLSQVEAQEITPKGEFVLVLRGI